MKNLLPARESLIGHMHRMLDQDTETPNSHWVSNREAIIYYITNLCDEVEVPDNVDVIPMNYPSIAVLYTHNKAWQDDRIPGCEGPIHVIIPNSIAVTASTRRLRRVDFLDLNKSITRNAEEISAECLQLSEASIQAIFCPYTLAIRNEAVMMDGICRHDTPYFRYAKKVLYAK